MKATAHANINMALTKYWGKRDKSLILPQNGSVSVTFSDYGTDTTVEFSDKYKQDIFILDGEEYTEGKEYERVVGQLDDVRKAANNIQKAKVVSKNKVVTSAGLASSASGAAALAAAATKAAGLGLSLEELSVFARLGSGSATRSVLGGFVEWTKGEKPDGTDSIAVQVADENHWPELRIVSCIVENGQKKIKSRAGMAQTVDTCPFYPNWLDHVQEDIDNMKQAIKDKDFTKLGEITEHNTLKLHTIMMTTKPAIIYWQPLTIELIQSVIQWRDEGLECYFTIDGGPQVKIYCLDKDVEQLTQKLKQISEIKDTVVCKPGKGISYADEHLF